MYEYIEREALRDALYDADAITMSGVKILNQFPAADVATVRHGRWVHEHISEGYAWVICSECEAVIHKILINKRLNYCPNCGAKMDMRSTVNNNANKEIG